MSEGKQKILIRIITETYEYDPDKVKRQFSMQWRLYANKVKVRREERSLPALSEEQILESWLIEMFEEHEGSIFGDKIFGLVEWGQGIELGERSYDE